MSTQPTVRQRRLGAELRRLRDGAHVSADRVAERLDCHISKLSRIELGQSPVRRLDLEAMLDLYGLTDDHRRASLFRLARSARARGWWQTYTDVLPAAHADFIQLEADALRADAFETLLAPELLQTPEYARAVLRAAAPGEPEHTVERLVEARLRRQALLTGEHPLTLRVVMCEAALTQRIGGPETMRGQLRRLVEVLRLPNVTLRVVPRSIGAHPGLSGPFTTLGFDDGPDPDVVLAENLTSSLFFEDTAALARYRWAFDRLTAIASEPRASAAIVRQALYHLS